MAIRPARKHVSRSVKQKVAGGKSADLYVDLREFHGRYALHVTIDTDASFERTFAGHVETGRPSVSDPAFGMAWLGFARSGQTL